jgi:DNA-binding MarR family transcriptional regulator
VTREAAPEDRRGAYAVLTDVGLSRFETAAEAHMAFVRRDFLELFSTTELARMAGFWDRVRRRQTR